MIEAPPGIVLRNLELQFQARQVLRGLDLTLKAGSWTGLLGRSGVGKSSLLKLIAGLIGNGGGKGSICASDGRPLKGRIGYMAQQDLLFPWLTLLENVTLGERLRGGPAAARRAGARAAGLLERVGLGDRLGDRPASLSGGMRQRVALARTLMEDRPVVLMDEPFSALDAITRIDLQDLSAELLTGRTVLLVTHDPLEALRLCHEVHVLEGGGEIRQPAISFDSLPPRLSGDPAVLQAQGELLGRLAGRGVML